MEYAYKNLDLDDIKDEQWEDVPGLDGYFLISNFGRVKRCEYEMQYRNGAIYVKPEMIIKPQIVKAPNKFKADVSFNLTTRLTISGKRHSFMLSRLVYYCFVRPFDLDDLSIYILTRDGDNFNIHPSNLITATSRQRQQRTVSKKRFRSPLLDLSEKIRSDNRQKIIRSLQKQVSQYDLSGKKIHTYKSLIAAREATGISEVSISSVTRGDTIRAGNFFWRFGKEPKIDIETFLKDRQHKNRRSRGIKVTQYTLQGKRIASFPSIEDAKEITGVSSTAIGMVIRGKYKSALGFYWKKGDGPQKIDLAGYKWGKQSMAVTQSKPVAQYTLKGKYLRTFASVKDAASHIGVNSSSMSGACRGLQQICKGFRWSFE